MPTLKTAGAPGSAHCLQLTKIANELADLAIERSLELAENGDDIAVRGLRLLPAPAAA